MAGNRRFAIVLDATLVARLDALKARLGLSRAEQMRRAAILWLDSMEWPSHAGRLKRPEGVKHAIRREPPAGSIDPRPR